MGVALWRTLSGQGGLRNHGIADDQRLTTNDQRPILRLRLSLQLYVPTGQLHRELNILAVVLLADLRRLLLHKRGEGIEIARNVLSRLLFGGDQRVVQALELFAARFTF